MFTIKWFHDKLFRDSFFKFLFYNKKQSEFNLRKLKSEIEKPTMLFATFTASF